MKEFLFKLFIGFIVLLAVLFLARNMIVKFAFEKGVKEVAGLGLKTEKFNVDIGKTSVKVKGLRLFNPEGYRERTMISMPEFFVDYELMSMLRDRIHLEDLDIYIKEFVIVKNEKGELNLDSLKSLQKNKQPSIKGRKKQIQIDHFRLRVGTVVYKDYSRGDPPMIKEFHLNLDQRFDDVDDPDTLVRLIVAKSIIHTSIGQLANINLGLLVEGIPATLKGALMGTVETGKGIGKKGIDAAKGVLGKTKRTLKKLLPFK